MAIFDARFGQRRGQRFLAKLWMTTGAWETADVGQELNLGGGEQLEQLFDGPGGMADGPDRGQSCVRRGHKMNCTRRRSRAAGWGSALWLSWPIECNYASQGFDLPDSSFLQRSFAARPRH